MDNSKKLAILVGGSDLFLGFRGISPGTKMIREKINSYYDEVMAVNFNYFLDGGRCLKNLQVKLENGNYGRIILYGCSQGGEIVLRLARTLQGKCEIPLLVTVDIANGPWSNSIDRKVPSNVLKNINIFQETPNIPLRSYGLPATGGPETDIININVTKQKIKGKIITHTNIEKLVADQVCDWLVRA